VPFPGNARCICRAQRTWIVARQSTGLPRLPGFVVRPVSSGRNRLQRPVGSFQSCNVGLFSCMAGLKLCAAALLRLAAGQLFKKIPVLLTGCFAAWAKQAISRHHWLQFCTLRW